MHLFQGGWSSHCFQSPNVTFFSVIEHNFLHLFMFIDWQSTVLHSFCVWYASACVKRLIRLSHTQAEQIGRLEKRKLFVGRFYFMFDTWNEYFLNTVSPLETTGRTVMFILVFLLCGYFFYQKKERRKIRCSRNPSVVTFMRTKCTEKYG